MGRLDQAGVREVIGLPKISWRPLTIADPPWLWHVTWGATVFYSAEALAEQYLADGTAPRRKSGKLDMRYRRSRLVARMRPDRIAN
jgi:hypothetical protein